MPEPLPCAVVHEGSDVRGTSVGTQPRPQSDACACAGMPGLLDLDELLASLAGTGDPLGAMAALELLQDLSRRVDVAAAGLLGSTAVPRLLTMTRSGDAMLRAQALQARRWPWLDVLIIRAWICSLERGTRLQAEVRVGAGSLSMRQNFLAG